MRMPRPLLEILADGLDFFCGVGGMFPCQREIGQGKVVKQRAVGGVGAPLRAPWRLETWDLPCHQL